MPSSISDTIGLDGFNIEDADSLDGSMADGMEHMFNASTQLRFGRDLRLNEVFLSLSLHTLIWLFKQAQS